MIDWTGFSFNGFTVTEKRHETAIVRNGKEFALWARGEWHLLVQSASEAPATIEAIRKADEYSHEYYVAHRSDPPKENTWHGGWLLSVHNNELFCRHESGGHTWMIPVSNEALEACVGMLERKGR